MSTLFARRTPTCSSRAAPLSCGKKTATPELLADVLERLRGLGDIQGSEVVRLPPLFANEAEFDEFEARHATEKVKRADLSSYEGVAYLGIDAGSTTFKSALIGEDGSLLWTFYANNKGDVLGTAKRAIAEMYAALAHRSRRPAEGCHWTCNRDRLRRGPAARGAARRLAAEIETVAHLRGAQEMLPGVEFILDIGGQDMKCLRVKDGVIDHIMLNEACSSGCGSFIESFAAGLNLDVTEFAKTANAAENPVDLGSRCTVFMNSRVKQAQKEGATVGDIAAGLAISVIKNALFKVIKIRDPKEVGTKVIVQGGTFLNDAVLRAFEQLAGVHAVRPDIAGNMGAYGAALLARDRYQAAVRAAERAGKTADVHTAMLGAAALEALAPTHKTVRCKACANHCLLTVNDFGKDEATGKHRRFITGNRCEKGAGVLNEKSDVPNLFEYKSHRLFDYEPLAPDAAPRGTVGIPRALSMYDNVPVPVHLLHEAGLAARTLSDPSTKKTYEAGIESMPSETRAPPGEALDGHIMNLLEKHPDFIWFPCSQWERQEDATAGNHFNCPIVASYAEALRLNIDELRESDVQFLNPWLPYDKKDHLKKRLMVELYRRTPSSWAKALPRPRRPKSTPRLTPHGPKTKPSSAIFARRARKPCCGWKKRARTALYWPAARTTTTPKSITRFPSCSRASAWPCLRKTPSRTWARSSVPFAWWTNGCITRASTPPRRLPPSAATSILFS